MGSFGQHSSQLPQYSGNTLTVPVSTLASLEANPRVAYVSPNRTTSGFLDISAQTVNANALWSQALTEQALGSP